MQQKMPIMPRSYSIQEERRMLRHIFWYRLRRRVRRTAKIGAVVLVIGAVVLALAVFGIPNALALHQ